MDTRHVAVNMDRRAPPSRAEQESVNKILQLIIAGAEEGESNTTQSRPPVYTANSSGNTELILSSCYLMIYTIYRFVNTKHCKRSIRDSNTFLHLVSYTWFYVVSINNCLIVSVMLKRESIFEHIFEYWPSVPLFTHVPSDVVFCSTLTNQDIKFHIFLCWLRVAHPPIRQYMDGLKMPKKNRPEKLTFSIEE